MSDSEDEILAGRNSNGRRLRRRMGARNAVVRSGARLRDGSSESAESNGSDSGSEIEQPVRKRKTNKAMVEEDDEAGPSGLQQQQPAVVDSSEWESDWNSAEEEQMLIDGGQKAAVVLANKLGYASDSSSSSSDSEKCPICLLSLNDQEIGVPEVCEHIFCAPCIEEWSKNVTTCPIDRKNFDVINIYKDVDRKHLLRKNQVQKKAASDVPALEDHELTYCEVCRRPDREETMLLCDSCNLGYHMECLSPPLEEIPTGSWYCDCCFASGSEEDDNEVQDLLNDLDEMGGMRPTRMRQRMSSPPRIVRTRQSERIREAILTRTSTRVRLNVVENPNQPGPSSRRAADASTSAIPARARAVRKHRKRRTRRKILRMIISEYDVDNDNEKFAIKRKKIYKTLKRLSKKRSARKRTRKSKNPELTPGLTQGGADLQRQRFSTGIPSLKLFGGGDYDLEYFSDEGPMESDISIGGRGETAVQSVRSTFRNPLGQRRALKTGFEPSSSSGPVDILGSIMESQQRWHSKQGLKDVKIDNGKIVFQNDSPRKACNPPPGANQAGVGQNTQNNVSLSNSSAGAADSTSSDRGTSNNQSDTSFGRVGSGSAVGGSGSGGQNNDDSVPDPSDMSIFVDLPPPKNSRDDEEEKKKKKAEVDMFDSKSPIPLPSAPSSTNPAPESTTSDDALGPGTSKGFGKFKFTMTAESNNCPNFSVYSSETLQYAKTGGEEPYDPLDSEQKTDDEYEERDEDLVQLDDEEPVVPKPTVSADDNDQENIPNGTDKLPTGELDHDAFESDSDDELKKIEETDTSVGPEPQPTNEMEALTPPLTTTVAAALASSVAAVTTMAGSQLGTVVYGEASTTTTPAITSTAAANSAQGEEDRSYTPCLDEKYQEARREQDRSGMTPTLPPPSKEGIDGMDTELISEEDEDTFKEDEARPSSSAAKPSSSGTKKKDLTFKKVNKKGKERNYRDKEHKRKDRNEDKENESRRSRERERPRRPKRKELQRYDVRTVIAEKRPKVYKDPFGRDVTPKPRSKTRSRSRSRSRTRERSPERRRELSISLSPEPPRRFNRRRSFSPRFRARNRTPPQFRRNVSRSPSRGPRIRSISRSRSRSPVNARTRPLSRSISRSFTPRARIPRSLTRSPKSRSPEIRGAKAKKPKKKKRPTSISRSASPSEGRGRKKTKKGRKKKNKHRGTSPNKKKKNRRRSSSPMMSRSRSRSPSALPVPTTGVLTERFTKVRQQNSWTPPPPARPKTNGTNLTVILTNEEALAKQAKDRERKRKEARRRDRARDKNLPSKEVFTSGDNILVSVSFNDKNLNKENQEVADGEAQKRLKDMAKKRAEAEKAKRRRLERLKKTRGEAPKPVVIIDLDRSPFRVLTPSPRAVIVLSDSDGEKDKDRREAEANRVSAVNTQQASADSGAVGSASSQRKSPLERHEEDMFGPKTPPGFPSQPQPSQNKSQAPKFTMQVKSKQSNIRPTNLLYEPGELDEGKTPERMDNAESSSMNYNMVGPNTPPEPAPQSPSPDVYDPFEPTKSPSPSPSRRDNASIERLSDLDDAVLPSSSGKVDGPDSGTSGDPKVDSQNQDELVNGETEPPRANKITILSNIVISQPTNSNQGVVSGSGVSASQNTNGDDSDVIFDDFVSSSAPAPSNNIGYSTSSSNPIKSYSTAANSSSLISKLPLPPGANAGQKFNDFINPTDSPYSPGASDFDDLFEPGGGGDMDSPPAPPVKQSYKPTKINPKGGKKTFDNLFGSSPNNNFKRGKKASHKKRAKPKVGDDDEDLSKLSTKERFMRKLNRLERVVEEVKLVIKPFYNKKQINKEEYKDILRRAVPKICHSRTGEINPIKIQKLIKAYVRKVRARRRGTKKGNLGGAATINAPGTNSNPLVI
ncbi:PHD and RING finger domain-containing protein 1-like [Toxorhynchites rutilus septentrionalis]|uniref:PHD and RING finger domain-containing protein 1-like n=1 Tax=Toxorhynchites rutilus septentrionalis TaxID=329112 RepID=UPI0024784656|nr:PHD and RING finger domain-containing protein 1-like [Toxorhynchites rutilus septentrionalis]